MSFLRALQKRKQNIELKENGRQDQQDQIAVTGMVHT